MVLASSNGSARFQEYTLDAERKNACPVSIPTLCGAMATLTLVGAIVIARVPFSYLEVQNVAERSL